MSSPFNEEQPLIDYLETRYDNDLHYNDPYDPDDYLPDPTEDYDSELIEAEDDGDGCEVEIIDLDNDDGTEVEIY